MNYQNLLNTIVNLTEGESDPVSLMATVVCEIHHADDRFDWTGFYRVTAPEMLKVGPYQGGHGCLTIPFSRGICGAAARSKEVQLIADVNLVVDHIACSATTKSEIVVPVLDGSDTLIAVLDIDSDRPNAFTVDDANGLQKIMRKVFAK